MHTIWQIVSSFDRESVVSVIRVYDLQPVEKYSISRNSFVNVCNAKQLEDNRLNSTRLLVPSIIKLQNSTA